MREDMAERGQHTEKQDIRPPPESQTRIGSERSDEAGVIRLHDDAPGGQAAVRARALSVVCTG